MHGMLFWYTTVVVMYMNNKCNLDISMRNVNNVFLHLVAYFGMWILWESSPITTFVFCESKCLVIQYGIHRQVRSCARFATCTFCRWLV